MIFQKIFSHFDLIAFYLFLLRNKFSGALHAKEKIPEIQNLAILSQTFILQFSIATEFSGLHGNLLDCRVLCKPQNLGPIECNHQQTHQIASFTKITIFNKITSFSKEQAALASFQKFCQESAFCYLLQNSTFPAISRESC